MTHPSPNLFTGVESKQWARWETVETQHAHTLLCAQTACSLPQWYRVTTHTIFISAAALQIGICPKTNDMLGLILSNIFNSLDNGAERTISLFVYDTKLEGWLMDSRSELLFRRALTNRKKWANEHHALQQSQMQNAELKT